MIEPRTIFTVLLKLILRQLYKGKFHSFHLIWSILLFLFTFYVRTTQTMNTIDDECCGMADKCHANNVTLTRVLTPGNVAMLLQHDGR